MQMKLTLSASVVLYKIIVKLLFTEEGKEREIPFNIRYKLQRSLEMLEKDAIYFEQERVKLVEKYGEKQEDDTLKVSDANMESFNEEAQKLLAKEVSHSFIKLSPEEVLQITVEGIGHDEMTLFIAAMIDDPELQADIGTPIENNDTKSGEAESENVSVEKEEAANK